MAVEEQNVEGPHDPLSPPSEQESLGEIAVQYWQLLRQYYWVILLATIATTVGAYVFTQYQSEIYQAQSKIIFHQGQDNVFGRQIEKVDMMQTGDHWAFEQFWKTQKEVLESRWFAERVVKRAGLLGNDEFLPPLEKGAEITDEERDLISKARELTDSLSYLDVVVNRMEDERKEKLSSLVDKEANLSSQADDQASDDSETKQKLEETRKELGKLVKQAHTDLLRDAASKVQGNSRIARESESRVGIISIKMSDAELASLVANEMADAYVDYTEEVQSSGLNKMTEWFDSYVKDKRKDLEAAQKKLQEFKRKNNILSFSYEDRQNLTASSMKKVNEQLLTVREKLASKEALLDQIREIETSDANQKAIADMVDNQSLTKLFEREAKLEQELSQLKTRYLDNHPEVQATSAELETVRENIDAEVERIKSSVENNVQVLRKNKTSLEKELSTLKEKIFRLNELGVQYTQLSDRVDNLKELYDTVLQRSSELDINSLYEQNDIEVLEHARAPETPTSPSLPMNLAAGLLAGIVLGGGTITLIEGLDDTIRSEADVEEFTDKPILAMLPRLKPGVLRGLQEIGESAADTITHTAPKSSFAEGIKTLRTNLTFMAPDDPPTTMLVTSPGPGEGKTLASTNTAIAMAQSGLDTLLVDTDLRKPRIHRALNLSKDPGMSGAIKGDYEVKDVTAETQIENLDVLTSGEVPPNPSELLHSERFGEIVETLRKEYDRVIFDSPPLAAVSDALILSQSVDGVLLILEFGKTRRGTFKRSLEQLHGIGAPLLGCVINEIDIDKTGYGYDYSYYRYSYYGEEEQPRREKDGSSKLAS
jgi:capsular exopolysaccharide synthesis family protein